MVVRVVAFDDIKLLVVRVGVYGICLEDVEKFMIYLVEYAQGMLKHQVPNSRLIRNS